MLQFSPSYVALACTLQALRVVDEACKFRLEWLRRAVWDFDDDQLMQCRALLERIIAHAVEDEADMDMPPPAPPGSSCSVVAENDRVSPDSVVMLSEA